MKLDLGCGNTVKKGFIGVDLYSINPEKSIIKKDCLEYIEGLKSNSVTEIYTRHFLEHVDRLDKYFIEFGRVLKKGGKITIIVPHHSNPYYYSDPTHKNFFGLYTLCYYFPTALFKRKVPIYTNIYNREIYLTNIHLKLLTRRSVIMKLCSKLVGYLLRSNSFKEYIERYLTPFFPIYEIKYTLEKL